MKNRSENSAGRGQISSIFWSIVILLTKKLAEYGLGQADLQPISFKSDRLLAWALTREELECSQRWPAPLKLTTLAGIGLILNPTIRQALTLSGLRG